MKNFLKKKIVLCKYLTNIFFVIIQRDGLQNAFLRVWRKFMSLRRIHPVYAGLSDKNLEEVVFEKFYNSDISHKFADVIVCVHNAPQDVKKCLNSIIKNSSQSIKKIIIVDDGSDEETRNILESFVNQHKTITLLVRNNQALGYTIAANIGLRLSKSDYVILLNSDTIVTLGWIDAMIRCGESDLRVGIIGPLSNTASWQSVPQIEESGDWAENIIPEKIDLEEWAMAIHERSACLYPKISFLNGFCFMIKRAVIDEIGIFDEVTFARGYGEENDYCIRVKKAGWKLAVCDDIYIYHAQSKSYSSEKRIILANVANKALIKKHGHAIINFGVEQCKNNIEMHGIRLRVANIEQYIKTKRVIVKNFFGKKIIFILPVGAIGGGANVVLMEAERMIESGITVVIANLLSNKEKFIACYPQWDDKTIFFDDGKDLEIYAKDYDYIIATANFSVEWLKGCDEKGMRMGYYIQDYEPMFYKENSFEQKRAKHSYEIFERMKLFSKTQWTANQVYKNHNREVCVVGESFEERIFAPRQRKSVMCEDVVRICAMIRPTSPRRNAEMTMKILKKLKEEFKDKIDIVIFGLKINDPDFRFLEYNFNFTNLGILQSENLAKLFGECDIFIDLSIFQAMGLTAMEAMASGLAVVVPKDGGSTEFALHEVNAIVVNSLNFEESLMGISRLIENQALRHYLSQNAMRDMSLKSPIFCVEKMMNCLVESK